MQAGAIYSLRVAIGDNSINEPGDLRIGFKLNDAFVTGGDTTLLAAVAANYAPEGTFRDFSFNYTAQSADVGKQLKIFLGQTGGDFVNYDNVRLDVQPVPEPATWAMMALGLGAMGWM